MHKTLQIRNMPEAMHRRLKGLAAFAGMTLSENVLAEIKRSLQQPTREEMLARLGTFDRDDLRPSAADAVRAERDAR